MANTITLIRLLLVPIFVWLAIARPEQSFLIVFIFSFAALTDWLDGFIARRFNQVTELGKLLDPLVDRVLVLSALFVLFYKGSIPGWAAVILVAREVVAILGYQLLRARNKEMSVSMLGKVATAILFVSFAALLGEITFGKWIFFAGLFLSLVALVDYMFKGSKKLLRSA